VCTGCSSGNYFELKVGENVCSCQAGYYLSGEMCVKCPVGCTECSSATVCTLCDTASGFGISGSSCVCDAMHFAVGHVCVECSTLIVGCSECSSATLCTKCVNTPHLQ
jgi:proprotein convertase subtilisin/kexin type 5